MSAKSDGGEDLDAFLTLLESKLRGPFSSLDLSKTVATTALTSASKATQYLENVCAVLPRAEKVTQLRVLTGLLGLDPAEETDAAVASIVRAAQESPVYEEWVRIVAGLVQGILFEGNDSDTSQRAGTFLNGEEARKLLEKTCSEVLDRVRKLESKTVTIDEDTEHRLGQSDAAPTMAPYRYSLLSSDLLRQVIPEVARHDHFQVNEAADILLMDSRLELEKAREEQEHQQAGLIAKAGAASKNPKAKAPDAPDFPGFQSTKKPVAKARPKASMFLPSKRPAGMGKRPLGTKPTGGLKPVQKTALKVRKTGAAQALLGKGRARPQAAATAAAKAGGSAAPSAVRGRTAVANRMGNARSRMKMLDVTEVQGLETKKQEATIAPPPAKRGRKALLAGSKRSKTDASTTAGGDPEKVARPTKKAALLNGDSKPPPVAAAAAPEPAPAAANPVNAAAAMAALATYQAQMASTTATAASHHGSPSTHAKQQDWRQLLREKSNRLSDEDRMRIQQFFVNHANPTPQNSTCKLKLHEERTTDAKTGEPVKETYYIELDYTNFTSKQSKKIKRYKE